jgi:hypothetical protein
VEPRRCCGSTETYDNAVWAHELGEFAVGRASAICWMHGLRLGSWPALAPAVSLGCESVPVCRLFRYAERRENEAGSLLGQRR